MATTGNTQAPSALAAQPPSPPPANVASPPSKRDLSRWWNGFKNKTKKEEERGKAEFTSVFYFLAVHGVVRLEGASMTARLSHLVTYRYIE